MLQYDTTISQSEYHGPLFYQESIYLPCRWLSSGMLKDIIFGVKVATNNDFCQDTVQLTR